MSRRSHTNMHIILLFICTIILLHINHCPTVNAAQKPPDNNVYVSALPPSMYPSDTYQFTLSTSSAFNNFTATPSFQPSIPNLYVSPLNQSFDVNRIITFTLTYSGSELTHDVELFISLSGVDAMSLSVSYLGNRVVRIRDYPTLYNEMAGGLHNAYVDAGFDDGLSGTDTPLSFNYPIDLSFNTNYKENTLYILDAYNYAVRMYNFTTNILSTLYIGQIDNIERYDFTDPSFLIQHPVNKDIFFIGDKSSCSILELNASTSSIKTLAGGMCDYWTNNQGLFNTPNCATINQDGTKLYFADPYTLFQMSTSIDGALTVLFTPTDGYAITSLTYAATKDTLYLASRRAWGKQLGVQFTGNDAHKGSLTNGGVIEIGPLITPYIASLGLSDANIKLSYLVGGNISQSIDGVGMSAHFTSIDEIQLDSAQSIIYVGDGCLLRKFTISSNTVTTMIGKTRTDINGIQRQICGNQDGTGSNALVSSVRGISFDKNNHLMFADNVKNSLYSLNIKTLLLTPLIPLQTCVIHEGTSDGPGINWNARSMDGVMFSMSSAANSNTMLYVNETFDDGAYNFFQINLLTNYKSTLNLPASVYQQIAYASLKAIDPSDPTFFFVSHDSYYSQTNLYSYSFSTQQTTTSAVATNFDSYNPYISDMYYSQSTTYLYWYQDYGYDSNCSYARMLKKYMNLNVTKGYAEIIRADDFCGKQAAGLYGNAWLNDRGFVIDEASQIMYSIQNQILYYEVDFERVIRINQYYLTTGVTNYLFQSQYSSQAVVSASDGYDGVATLYDPSSITINSQGTKLYIYDHFQVREIDIANKYIKTISGDGLDNTNKEWNYCREQTGLLQMYEQSMHLAVDQRDDNLLYVQGKKKIRTLIVGDNPVITSIQPTQFSVIDSMLLTIQGYQFGFDATVLPVIQFQDTTGAIKTQTCSQPIYNSSTLIFCQTNAALPFGSYRATVRVGNYISLVSREIITVRELGNIQGASPVSFPAYTATNITVRASDFGSAAIFNTRIAAILYSEVSNATNKDSAAVASSGRVARGSPLTDVTSSETNLTDVIQNTAADANSTSTSVKNSLNVTPLSSRCTALYFIDSKTVLCTLNNDVPYNTTIEFKIINAQNISTHITNSSVKVTSGMFIPPFVNITANITANITVNITSNSSISLNTTGSTLSCINFNNCSNIIVSTATTVTTSLGLVLNLTSPTYNPCFTSNNPCRNGAKCVFTPWNNSTRSGNTITCKCFPGFFGPYCTLGVLGCLNCVALSSGGSNISLIGVGFSAINSIRLFSQTVNITRSHISATGNSEVTAILSPWTTLESVSTLNVITFKSVPRQNTTTASRRLLATTTNSNQTYPPLSVDVSFPGGYSFSYSLNALIYYTDDPCVAVNQWKSDGNGGCLPCPVGGYCSGGGRVWPKPGYWSYNEYVEPVSCKLRGCPGLVQSTAYTDQNIGTGQKNTQLCTEGYSGVTCSSCSSGYYLSESRCWKCSDDANAKAYFSLMLIVSFGLMLGLSIAVAVLNARYLAILVGGFILFQNVVIVGKSGSNSFPDNAAGQGMTDFFNAASIINFDIEVFQFGCNGPPITFLELFWYTFLLFGCTFFMFICACFIRRCLRLRLEAQFEKRQNEQAFAEQYHKQLVQRQSSIESQPYNPSAVVPDAPQHVIEMNKQQPHALFNIFDLKVHPNVDFKRRLMHSMLILLSIYYLKLTTLSVRGLYCFNTSDPSPIDGSYIVSTRSYYLVVDGYTKCYHGDHLGTSIFIIIWFIFYVIGFPIFCFCVLTRAFFTNESKGLVAWLVRRVKCLQAPSRRQRFQHANEQKERGNRVVDITPNKPHAPSADAPQTPVRPPPLESAPSTSQAPMSPGIMSPSSPGYHNQHLWDVGNNFVASPAHHHVGFTKEQDEEYKQAQLDRARVDMFGYLFIKLKAEHVLYRLFNQFPVNLYYALVSNLVDSTSLQLFLLGLMSTIQFASIIFSLPFVAVFTNMRLAAVYLASLLHVLAMLIGGDTIAQLQTPYFIILAVLWFISLLFFIFRSRLNACLNSIGGGDETRSPQEDHDVVDSPNFLTPEQAAALQANNNQQQQQAAHGNQEPLKIITEEPGPAQSSEPEPEPARPSTPVRRLSRAEKNERLDDILQHSDFPATPRSAAANTLDPNAVPPSSPHAHSHGHGDRTIKRKPSRAEVNEQIKEALSHEQFPGHSPEAL